MNTVYFATLNLYHLRVDDMQDECVPPLIRNIERTDLDQSVDDFLSLMLDTPESDIRSGIYEESDRAFFSGYSLFYEPLRETKKGTSQEDHSLIPKRRLDVYLLDPINSEEYMMLRPSENLKDVLSSSEGSRYLSKSMCLGAEIYSFSLQFKIF